MHVSSNYGANRLLLDDVDSSPKCFTHVKDLLLFLPKTEAKFKLRSYICVPSKFLSNAALLAYFLGVHSNVRNLEAGCECLC